MPEDQHKALTMDQLNTLRREVAAGTRIEKVVTHPYSGVATATIGRRAVVLVDPDGRVAYRGS